MPQKTVLITGCSSGIGHSLALEFASQNFRVFATARNPASISDLATHGIETFALEATSEESILALHREISKRSSPGGGGGGEGGGGIFQLDYLINNAGRNYTVPALDVEMSEIRETFETNVFAVMRLCQIFAPCLIESKGTIVQIGSVAAVMPYVFGSVYNASKAALHAYTDTLRVELEPFGVKVVTIVTGGVKSNIARTERKLPRGSVYLPIEREYEERLTHSQANGVENEVYARRVVGQILAKPGKERIWEGGKSWLIWFVYTFLPRGVLGWAMGRMFKLWKLRGTWEERQRKVE